MFSSDGLLFNWLYQHKRCGPTLLAWEQFRIIPLQAKILATVMIMASLAYLWLAASIANVVRLLVTLLVAATVAYIWSKPHRRPNT